MGSTCTKLDSKLVAETELGLKPPGLSSVILGSTLCHPRCTSTVRVRVLVTWAQLLQTNEHRSQGAAENYGV